jgi:hypothetical protein
MPATSIRDLFIKGDDLIAGTHGRGFWILDDIMPLRSITPDVARAPAFLFRAPTAYRTVWNKNTDTPLPPDEPTAPNPPEGVSVSYFVGPGSLTGPVTLEVTEALTGEVIRRYSSDDPPDSPVPAPNIPDYWIRPERRLLATPGLHRFAWDLRYAPPTVPAFEYGIAAVPFNTAKSPQGMWAMPGTYQLRLTVNGRAYRQAVIVRMDPRMKTSVADLTLQYKQSKALDDAMRLAVAATADLKKRLAAAPSADRTALQSLADTLQAAYDPLPDLFTRIQAAAARPTDAQDAAATAALAKISKALTDYQAIK